MSPLEAQRQRILAELEEGQDQLQLLEQQLTPDLRMINYYTDVVRHNQAILESIEAHLPDICSDIAKEKQG